MRVGHKKILLIGVDQAIPYLTKKFMNEGLLPNISQLTDNGTIGEAYSCPPCDTPTNWTTIATGSTTAIHGATSFYMHIPGEPFEYGLNIRSRSSLSRYCGAEYFWEVADKKGLKTFILNYPAGWPGSLKNGVISLLTWPLPESISRELTLKTELKYKKNTSKPFLKIDLAEKINRDLKSLSPQLQITIKMFNKNVKEFPPLTAYIIDTEGSGYDSVAIQSENDKNWQILKIGQWSDWILNDILTNHGILPCLFKVRIGNLSSEGNLLELQFSNIYNTKGWTNPEDIGEKIIRNAINYDIAREQKVDYMISGKIKSYLKLARNEALTIAQTISYMKKFMNWDICFFHIHLLDSVNHKTLGYLYKNSALYSEQKEEKAWEHIKTAYRIVDELVKLLIEQCVDKDTIVVFLADHGAMPSWKVVNFLPALIEKNLLNYKIDNLQKKYIVDWSKTKAFPYLEPPYIWVNLKGRDPRGIVNSKDYETVRDEIIEVLYQLKDPETGEQIVKLALKREDADYLGQNGYRVGDVIYFLKPSYQLFDYRLDKLNPAIQTPDLLNYPLVYKAQVNCAAHAYYLPTEKLGEYSVSVPLIFNGPNINKGFQLKDHVDLIDIAPTLSHLLQIPKPKNAQGRVLHEIVV